MFPLREKAFWVAGVITACAVVVAVYVLGFLIEQSTAHWGRLAVPVCGLALWAYLYSRFRDRG